MKIIILLIAAYLVIAILNIIVYLGIAVFCFFKDETYTQKEFKRALVVAPQIGIFWIYLLLSFIDNLKIFLKKKMKLD